VVVAVFKGYNFTCLEKTSKHSKIYLTAPLPVGNGPYKSTEHNSPGLFGTWLLSCMSNVVSAGGELAISAFQNLAGSEDSD
jgi:hypothetical protein